MVYARDPEWAAKPIARLIASCHPKQRDAALDPSRLISADIPRSGGKTTTFLVRALRTMCARQEAYVPFIATTKGHATNILWRAVKRAMTAVSLDYRAFEVDKMIVLKKNGSILKLAGADDDAEVDKLRGFPIHGLGIDEAAFHKPKRLAYIIDEAVGPRLRGWVMLIGTPGPDPSGLFYEVTRPGGDLHRPYEDRGRPEYAGWTGWSSHRWTLEEAQTWARAGNVPRENELYDVWDEALRKKAANQWSDDNPKWRREYLGEWAKDDTNNIYKYRAEIDGVEWNRWDPERVGPLKVAKLPTDRTDWQWVLSLDRGHSDEFAINGFAFSPTDPLKRIYHVLCYERKRLYARQVACLLLGARGVEFAKVADSAAADEEAIPDARVHEAPDPLSPFGLLGIPLGKVCDSDMTLIDELTKVYGIRCTQAQRQREKKHGAIELLNGDLVDGRLKVLKGSPLEAQMTDLQWDVDEWGQLREPKGKPDHSSDCATYARSLIAHLFETGAVGEANKPAARAPTGRRMEPDPSVFDEQPEWLSALSDSDPYEATWP